VAEFCPFDEQFLENPVPLLDGKAALQFDRAAHCRVCLSFAPAKDPFPLAHGRM
jgi:hypothetical protein